MKRIFSILLCLILTSCLFIGAVNAVSTNLVLEYKAGTVKKGETVKVSLLIDNNMGFGTAIAKIGFNKANLELKSITKTYTPQGNYKNMHLDTSVANANKVGKVTVGYTPDVLEPGVFTSPITYNGVLAELTFVALKDCTVEAYFAGYELYLDDMDMTDVPCSTVIKKINVLENTPSNVITSSGLNTSDKNPQNNSGNTVTTSKIVTSDNELTANTQSVENKVNTASNKQNNGNNDGVNYLYVLITVIVVAIVIVALALVIKGAKTKKK